MTKPKSKEELVEEFRVESIQEAAMRVIARKGVAGASMHDIAEEAGIAKGTIYLYFQNQRDLLERTVDYAFGRLARQLEAAIEGEGVFRERFERLFRTTVEFLEANVTLLQLYGATKFAEGTDARPGSCDRTARPHYQRYIERFQRFLRDAMEAGEIRTMDPTRLAQFLQEGFVGVLMERLKEEPKPPIDEEIAWLMETMFHGISNRRSHE